MKIKTIMLVGAIASMGAAWVHAAVTADEAKKLGTALTPFGSEAAGNKDGSIPAYTGGLTKPPAAYKSGMKKRPDPFEGEKPLYSIDAKNMDKYADQLSEGVKTLMKKYPTYRIDVYPTHRTTAYPKYVLDNTLKNATRCKTIDSGNGVEGCFGGLPFPIPKDGHEAMWNHLVRYQGHNVDINLHHYYVDAAGKAVHIATELAQEEFPYYDPNATRADVYWKLRDEVNGPARLAGERSILIDALNPMKTDRKIWQYLPGQRRTRAAPDLAYDTPIPNRGGAQTMDDIGLFSGKMDRYDFKLIGKKEMFIPYNNYKFVFGQNGCTPTTTLTPNHINPNCMRWEKHRVWVIEATLKPGKRHIYQKRVFYFDEDSYGSGMADQYDATGALYRVGFLYGVSRYEQPAMYSECFSHNDLISGVYAVTTLLGDDADGVVEVPKRPESNFSPDSLAGSGIR